MLTKSTKIIIAVIAATLVICISVVVGVNISNKNKQPELPPDSSTTAQSAPQTTAPTTTAATVEQQIVGKWMDSAQMSGYEFFTDGRVTVTYVNLTVPVIDLPINGTANGTYTIIGSTLNIKFSIYSRTISKNFEIVSISNRELVLRNTEDNEISTYSFVDNQTTTAVSSTTALPPVSDSAQAVNNSDIVGVWSNGDNSIVYSFNNDSTVNISFVNGRMASVSSGELNGSYKGIYMTNNGSLTVQFMMNENKITQELKYSINGNTMSITENSGETTLLVRSGSSINTSGTASDLIGKWTDGANMSGFTFKQGGSVDVTYVNFTVPVINMPINGTYPGTYSVSGNRVTVNFSIYGKNIMNAYEFSVAGETLTLKNFESGELSTYRRAG